jgi:DNA-binding response OmpR family regulator
MNIKPNNDRLKNVKTFKPFEARPLIKHNPVPAMSKEKNAKKVLVADDDDMSLAMVNMYLGSKGYEVLTAKDSLEAIRLLKEFKPDLLILDILMPFMSGLEMLSYIRFNFLIENVPVIIMSVMGSEEVKDAADKLGAYYYITKPFEMEDLVLMIDKIPGFSPKE